MCSLFRLNLIEVFMQFLTIYLVSYFFVFGTLPCILSNYPSHQIFKRSSKAILIGFLVSTFTFWKTLLYCLQYTELCNGSHRLKHIDRATTILMYIMPNGLWLTSCFILMIYYGKKLFIAIEYSRHVKKD